MFISFLILCVGFVLKLVTRASSDDRIALRSLLSATRVISVSACSFVFYLKRGWYLRASSGEFQGVYERLWERMRLLFFYHIDVPHAERCHFYHVLQEETELMHNRYGL